MSLTSCMSSLISSIKVGFKHKKFHGRCRYSRLNLHILDILQAKNYVADKKIDGYDIVFTLNKTKTMSNIVQISKPSCRIYVKHGELYSRVIFFRNGIVSTSRGLMTVHDAMHQKIGGELLLIYK